MRLNQHLSPPSEHLNLQWRKVRYCSSLYPPPQASLTSLKFSAVLPVGQVDPPIIETHSGGIKV